MKHLSRIVALILTLSNITAQQTVAVLDFEGIGLSKDEARALSDRFSTEFLSLSGGRFFLLERQRIGEILSEQGLQQAICSTSECAVQAGKALGAKLIITGSIAKVGTIISVNARMLDVESSQIINSISHDQEGDIGTLLIKGMKIVANKLLEDSRQISPLNYSESHRGQPYCR